MRSKKRFFLIVIILIAAVFRFYKLDWGEGYFFHPDEYHIGASVRQMSFPDQMHPHFFSYGTFISYLIYFTKEIATSIGIISESLNPILIGRFYSALFSTASIPFIYLLTSKVTKNNNSALLAASTATLTPGLIQQAHFATPESILIFWILVSLSSVVYWMEKNQIKYLLLSAFSFGAALSVKISGLIFVPAHGFAIVINDKLSFGKLPKKVLILTAFISISTVTFLLIYPYSLLDWKGFRHSMDYETGVGWGDPLVFYTRQFIDTTPLIFQFKKILPYVIDPVTLLLGLTGILYSGFKIFKSKRFPKKLSVILFSFLVFFIPSSFLFAKWTRFIIAAVPFFAIFAAITIDNIKKKEIAKSALIITSLSAFLWSWMFFQIYLNQDVRTRADEWLIKNLPHQSQVLTESGNMIEVPISRPQQKHSFDFYHLDENKMLQSELVQRLESADYFIVQSRRIFYNHQRLPGEFPVTSRFYNKLFSGELGFEHIKTFTSYPTLTFPGFNIRLADEGAEETWTVFDHPVVRVYEKTEHKTVEEYEKLLGLK